VIAMTVSPNNNREETEKQAAQWTARLETGPLTSHEQSELAAWLDANPDHRWLLSRYREL
jgi:ferric-dicitrate binding protein FerR (iron transport regulator)